MTEDTGVLCRRLVHGEFDDLPQYAEDPVPAELSLDYAKQLLVKELAASLPSVVIEAAFLKVALTISESDQLRFDCVQQLLNSGSEMAESALFGLLLDSDEEMRIAGLEGLVLLQTGRMFAALELLSNDDSTTVRQLVKRIGAGESIPLYHLDPPTGDT